MNEKLKKNSEVINKEDSDKIKIKEHEETNLETTEEYYTCPQFSDRCDSVNPVIKCNECDFIVRSEFCIENHNGMMHTFECYYCQSVFKTGKELNTHKEKYHSFPCYQCDFIGCSKAHLAKHMVEKDTETTQTEHIYNEE